MIEWNALFFSLMRLVVVSPSIFSGAMMAYDPENTADEMLRAFRSTAKAHFVAAAFCVGSLAFASGLLLSLGRRSKSSCCFLVVYRLFAAYVRQDISLSHLSASVNEVCGVLAVAGALVVAVDWQRDKRLPISCATHSQTSRQRTSDSAVQHEPLAVQAMVECSTEMETETDPVKSAILADILGNEPPHYSRLRENEEALRLKINALHCELASCGDREKQLVQMVDSYHWQVARMQLSGTELSVLLPQLEYSRKRNSMLEVRVSDLERENATLVEEKMSVAGLLSQYFERKEQARMRESSKPSLLS